MSERTTVEVDRGERVATVTLDRPDRLNAIDDRMTVELEAALQALDDDAGVRAIVLTGRGRGFCSGADVADLSAAAVAGGTDAGALRRQMRGSLRLARTLLDLETPLIAAVNGPCAGAGVGLALAADFAVAADSASVSVAFVGRGLVPDYATTFLLPRVVGLRVARELCLLGDTLTAAEAAQVGLVGRVVADEELAGASTDLAERLAAGPSVALGLTKRMLAEAFELDRHAATDRELTAQAIAFSTDDAAEGAAAFFAKRPPRFQGR